MYRLIYYEVRKSFLRKFIIGAFLLFLCLNIAMIYKGYLQGDGSYGYFMPHSSTYEKQWDFYYEMHDRLDGSLTTEKAQFVIDEHGRLSEIISDGTYSRNYKEDTYTGYEWGDYSTFYTYFYQPMEYMATYSGKINKVVQQAEENLEFYKQYENNYEYQKNKFIVDHYSGRVIDLFGDGKVWESLLLYNFSDLLMIMLILLVIIPIYVNEKETGMDTLILSGKNGMWSMASAKLIAIFLFVLFLVAVFSGVNLIIYNITYGLKGSDLPLYAIESFQYTPLNISVKEYYFLLVGLKYAGLCVFGIFIGILSKFSKNIVYPYIIGVLGGLIGIYLSGFISSIETGKSALAVFTPFTLLSGQLLYENLLGFCIGDRFLLRASVCIITQLVLLFIGVCICRYGYCKGKKFALEVEGKDDI